MTELLPLDTVSLPIRLRIEDYLLLDASGAFTAYAESESIEGVVFAINTRFRSRTGSNIPTTRTER